MIDIHLKRWLSIFSSNTLILASGIVSGVLVARFLEPEGRGLLAAILFWPHFVVGFASFGLNESITIESALKKNVNISIMKSTAFWLSILLAIMVSSVFYPIIPFLMGAGKESYHSFAQHYFLIFVVVSFITMNLSAVDLGIANYQRYNLLRILQNITYPVTICLLWYFNQLTVLHVAYAVMVGTVLIAMIYFVASIKTFFKFPDKSLANLLLLNGLRLHGTNIAMFMIAEVDKMFLTIWSNNQTLGLYAVALTVASTGQGVITKTFSDIILPKVAQTSGKQLGIEMASFIKRAFLLITFGNLVIYVTCPWLIPLFFGKVFIDAVPVAQILLLAFIFQGTKKTMIYLLRAQKKNKIGATAEIFSLIIFVTVIIYFYSEFNIKGVAYALLASHFFGFIYLILIFKREFKVRLFNFA